MHNKRLDQKVEYTNGFSMPEVLISSSILMMIVAGTAKSQINSIGITAISSQHNAVQSLVSEDIDRLRRETFHWMYKPAAACTGDPQHADIPMRYLTDKNSTLGQDGGHCEKKTLAENMVSDQPQIFPATDGVEWNATAPANEKNMIISRKIKADCNELTVRYLTSGGIKDFTSTTKLVPQAIHWCA